MKTKITLLIASLILSSIFFFNNGKWDKYYKNKINQSPHQIIVNALRLFQMEGQAIDLGCGVGNEALLLLNNGWNVWAIDSEPKAIQLVKSRSDINATGKLIAAIAKFEKDSTWEMLPTADFIYAAYALPFCKQEEFEKLWDHIKSHLTADGRFAGHFFGVNYTGFTNREMREMTFLQKEEIVMLFQDFDIEHFQEIEKDSLSGTGRPIHSHIFEVIARKKGAN